MKTTRFLWLAVLLFPLSAPVASAQAAPEVVIRHNHYPIHALSTRDLYDQVKRLGPRFNGDKMAFGTTTWQVGWNFRMQETARECRLASVSTRVDILITVPQLQDPEALPATARAAQERFVQTVIQHENVHRDHGIAAAVESERRMMALPAYPSCAQLKLVLNTVARQVVSKYEALDVAFDKRSRHEGEWPEF